MHNAPRQSPPTPMSGCLFVFCFHFYPKWPCSFYLSLCGWIDWHPLLTFGPIPVPNEIHIPILIETFIGVHMFSSMPTFFIMVSHPKPTLPIHCTRQPWGKERPSLFRPIMFSSIFIIFHPYVTSNIHHAHPHALEPVPHFLSICSSPRFSRFKNHKFFKRKLWEQEIPTDGPSLVDLNVELQNHRSFKRKLWEQDIPTRKPQIF